MAQRYKDGAQTFRKLFKEAILQTASVDVTALVDAAGETLSVTISGAAVGDIVLFSAPYDLEGRTVTAYVSAANTVKLRVQNESGSTVTNYAAADWTFIVLKPSFD